MPNTKKRLIIKVYGPGILMRANMGVL